MSQDKTTPKLPSTVPLPKMRRGPKAFYKDVVREMKLVNWPDRRETNRLTGVVLVICTMTVLFLLALSVIFDTLFRQLFRGGV